MSLNKQLWLAIAIIISLTFIGGVAVSSYYARHYYVDQLTVKNIDNTAGLALSLSQMEKDPVLLELMIAAQFDTGHYQRIELIATDGTVLVSKKYQATAEKKVPEWFSRVMAFDIPAGIAQVQDGWHQYGTLYLESHSSYALAALWQVSSRLLYWFLAIAMICGVVGSVVLRLITKPLAQVVEQAEAIGGRRFIISDEPKTLEFNRVVKAMNRLSGRIGQMLEAESRRLDELRKQSQQDSATGVANREYFFNRLDSRLSGQEQSTEDAVILLRIMDLNSLNKRMGRAATDQWILQLLSGCQKVLAEQQRCFGSYLVGRLNGSDFAILLTDTGFLPELNNALHAELSALTATAQMGAKPVLAQAAGYFYHNESRGNLMARLDSLLATAEELGQGPMLCDREQRSALFIDATGWRNALEQAINQQQLRLQMYPVKRITGEVLHQEGMLRMVLAGQDCSAGRVIGWARRLGLLAQLDINVLENGLKLLEQQPDLQLALNLSVDSLTDTSSRFALLKLLQQSKPEQLSRLALEWNEQTVLTAPELFSSFAYDVKQFGVQLGLQAAGSGISAISGIEQLGLDYLKVDAAMVRQYQQAEPQAFLRSLCSLGHSLGLLLIAEGIEQRADVRLLAEIGFDAVTGPGVSA